MRCPLEQEVEKLCLCPHKHYRTGCEDQAPAKTFHTPGLLQMVYRH